MKRHLLSGIRRTWVWVDNVYRLVPDDRREAEALVALLRRDQVKAIAPIWRNDAGNAGLVTSLRARFGGIASTGVAYGTGESGFSAEVAALHQKVAALRARKVGKVGVYLAGFDEVVDLFPRGCGRRDAGLRALVRERGRRAHDSAHQERRVPRPSPPRAAIRIPRSAWTPRQSDARRDCAPASARGSAAAQTRLRSPPTTPSRSSRGRPSGQAASARWVASGASSCGSPTATTASPAGSSSTPRATGHTAASTSGRCAETALLSPGTGRTATSQAASAAATSSSDRLAADSLRAAVATAPTPSLSAGGTEGRSIVSAWTRPSRPPGRSRPSS
jgi:hypothetical protein